MSNKLSIKLETVMLLTFVVCAGVETASAQIVISQIYGGGGNQGATLRNDFVELFNRGQSSVSITGWTLQHASATGSSWDRTTLAGVIQPGQYFLIQEQEGNAGSQSLPAPDAIGGIAISAIADKIALVSSSTNLSGSAPVSSQIVDFVGYGAANAAEGQPAGELDNTKALLRDSGGCADTQNNARDFSVSVPNPRNSRSSLNRCGSANPPVVLPQIAVGGVTNAASYQSHSIASGEIVTIFGANLGPSQLTTLQLASDGQHVSNTLAGTRVLFDGVPAPIIYTSSGQLSAVVPFAIAGRTATQLQVEYNGSLSAQVSIPLATSAPGIFTASGTGQGQGAILNQDYSVNSTSRPAPLGSIITVYMTGGGQTIPTSEDGSIASFQVLDWLSQPATAQIGGVPAEVMFSGAAPGLVTGVVQVNVRVPLQAAVGGAVPISVSIAGLPSQTGVTVAIAEP